MRGAERLRLIIAGGGTGGHLFPGIAIAEELRKRDKVDVLFVCTDKKITINALERYDLPTRTIRAKGLKGTGFLGALRALALIPSAIYRSLLILKEFRPHCIIGVGGYVSGPVILAGRLVGLKTAIQEQNSVPGLTNRILGRLVDKIFLSYPESERFFPRGKTLLTGNPVRRELLKASLEDRRKETFSILILGGSQGAHRLNEIATAALGRLSHLKEKLSFIHQTGEKDEAWVRSAYQAAGFKAMVSAFINDMGSAYGQADLVLCRAGAGTLAELTALGKASLLVPYPYAANNHQEENARSLERTGAAKVLIQESLTPERLAEEVMSLYENRGVLESMASRSLERGKTKAAALIADECLKMIDKD